jgi:hypothetical protein
VKASAALFNSSLRSRKISGNVIGVCTIESIVLNLRFPVVVSCSICLKKKQAAKIYSHYEKYGSWNKVFFTFNC